MSYLDLVPLMTSSDQRQKDTWREICEENERSRKAWITTLRSMDVKAARADDGWVDRERNEVTMCYPDFNDGLKVGDWLALGRHDGKTRIVEIVEETSVRYIHDQTKRFRFIPTNL